MAPRRQSRQSRQTYQRRPAVTPEGREQQLISSAIDLAEKQLTEGTASAQVITHFLKLASTREQLEQERLKNENLVLSKKVEQMDSARRIEELYESALNAMRNYSGHPEEVYDYDMD
jgi:hypothetical protein